VVPPQDREDFQAWAHGDHLSKKEILIRCEDYYYPAIIKDAEDRWKSCETCQAAILRKRKYVVSGNPVIARSFAQYVAMDWKGPLFDEVTGNHFFHLNFMDLLSRTVESVEFREESFENVCLGVQKWCSKGISMEYLLFDNDSTFGEKLLLFLSNRGIKGIPSSKRLSPEHIACLERYHGEFDRFRRTARDWRLKTPEFLFRWNSGRDLAGVARAESIFGISREKSKTLVQNTLLEKRAAKSESQKTKREPLSEGHRVIVQQPAPHKGAPTGAAATVIRSSKNGTSVSVKMHRDGEERLEDIRNIHRIGDVNLEKDPLIIGESVKQIGAVALYPYSGRLWLGRVTEILENGLRIMGLRASPETTHKHPRDRLFVPEGKEWVIRDDDVLAFGELSKNGKMKTHLLTRWRRFKEEKARAKKAADLAAAPQPKKRVSWADVAID